MIPPTPFAAATALLIMDVQPSIVALRPQAAAALFDPLRALRDAARAASVPVIYVVVGFRAGHPEVAASNMQFARVKADGRLLDEDVHPELRPAPGEVVVRKRRVSAFTGSDLDVVLRGLGIRHLLLSGISTSGVVLSTLRQAADLDYRISVVADGCMDPDDEVHELLLRKVFPRQAEVTTTSRLIDALRAGRAASNGAQS